MVGMVVGYRVGFTLYFDIPLPAQSYLGRWKFGRIGWSVGHYGGTINQSQPNPVTNHHPHPVQYTTGIVDRASGQMRDSRNLPPNI